MKAVVLAGGFGTRLRNRVPEVPKPMAPVAGRPFLEYVLEQLNDSKVREVVLSVGYRAEAISSHFGDTYKRLTLRYAMERTALGTGGALINSLKHEEPGAYLVLNGDSIVGIDFDDLMDWYGRKPSDVAMVLKAMPDTKRYGAVTVKEDRITGFSEKGQSGPGLINTGAYVVDSRVFDRFRLPECCSLEADLLQAHVRDLRPRAFVTEGWFIDIGIPAAYEKAQVELSDSRIGSRSGA